MKPSNWVVRWASLIKPGGNVLDLACGSGRHACFLAGLGLKVTALDRDLVLSDLVRDTIGVQWREQDLESGEWQPEAGAYSGVVVTNYLHRTLLPDLVSALASPGGVLIYETFAIGQEQFGRPRNPAHLLLPGELLEVARGHLRVVAYEDVLETASQNARIQRICAVKP